VRRPRDWYDNYLPPSEAAEVLRKWAKALTGEEVGTQVKISATFSYWNPNWAKDDAGRITSLQVGTRRRPW
jgi:hypothetical protein